MAVEAWLWCGVKERRLVFVRSSVGWEIFVGRGGVGSW